MAATVVCKNLARLCLKKLSVDRDVFAILFHDYLSLYDLLSPNPLMKALEVFDWSKTRPFLSLPVCSVSSVQQPKNDETTVVMTVWETELSLKFPSHAVALVWHYELDFRVSIDHPFGSYRFLDDTLCLRQFFSSQAMPRKQPRVISLWSRILLSSC